jgi:hypothetical protein
MPHATGVIRTAVPDGQVPKGKSEAIVPVVVQIMGGGSATVSFKIKGEDPGPPADLTPPEVKITNPQSGDIVPAAQVIQVSAEARDEVSLTKLTLSSSLTLATAGSCCPGIKDALDNPSCTGRLHHVVGDLLVTTGRP